MLLNSFRHGGRLAALNMLDCDMDTFGYVREVVLSIGEKALGCLKAKKDFLGQRRKFLSL